MEPARGLVLADSWPGSFARFIEINRFGKPILVLIRVITSPVMVARDQDGYYWITADGLR